MYLKLWSGQVVCYNGHLYKVLSVCEKYQTARLQLIGADGMMYAEVRQQRWGDIAPM